MTSREPGTPLWRTEDGQALLAQILDAMPTAIAFWDRDLCNVFANRAYVDWFGMTPDQLRGQSARTLLGPELFTRNVPYMRRALAGQPQRFERAVRTPSGEMREAQVEYTPYFSGAQVTGFITIMVDVTERADVERAARRAAEQLATLSERQRIEERAHEGILQDLFAVQLRIERARAAVSGNTAAADALDAALERLDVAVADLRLVLGSDARPPSSPLGTGAQAPLPAGRAGH